MTNSFLIKTSLFVVLTMLFGSSKQVFLKCTSEHFEVKSCGIYQGGTSATGESLEDIEIDKNARHVVFVIYTDEKIAEGEPKVTISKYELSDLFENTSRSLNIGTCPFIRDNEDETPSGTKASLYHTGNDISSNSLSDESVQKLINEQNSYLKENKKPLQNLRVGVIFCGGNRAYRADARKLHYTQPMKFATESIMHGLITIGLTVPYVVVSDENELSPTYKLIMFQTGSNSKLRVHAALCPSYDLTSTLNGKYFLRNKLTAVWKNSEDKQFTLPVKTLNFFYEIDCGKNINGFATTLAKYKQLDSRVYSYADKQDSVAVKTYPLEDVEETKVREYLVI